MEQIMQTLDRVMTARNSCTSQNPVTQVSHQECELCHDTGMIQTGDNVWKKCKCVEARRCMQLIQSSGISQSFQEKTVNGYKPKNDLQLAAKKMAADYIRNFQVIRESRDNSVAFLGQVGSGKTHLTIAIANALLKSGIGVRYMQYRETITYLKQLITDDFNYQREIGKYKKAPVLLIDDIYKGATNQGRVNESEMRIMFELINYRYLAKLPVLVSGEYGIDAMITMDEATGSRIAEMCKGRIIVFTGKELNYRMMG